MKKSLVLLFGLFLGNYFSVKAQNKTWSLNDCIAYALKNNVVLNQQKLTSETVGINYKQAKDNRLPNLNLSDVQSFSFGNTVYSSSNQVIRQNTNSNYPSLNSSVVLFNGFKYLNLVKENKLNFEASKLDIETQQNNLSLNITAAYVQILFEYEAVIITQHQIESDSLTVKRTELYVAVGQTPEDSLLLIKAQLARDRALKVSAETQVDLANLQLEQLMEMPIGADFFVDRTDQKEISPITTSSAADIYTIASSILPDEKSAALKSNAFKTDIEVNKAALLPSLSLTGGLSTGYYSALNRANYSTTYQNQPIGYLQSNPTETVVGPVAITTANTQPYPFADQIKDNFGQAIAINLSVPIFNNFKARNNIALAKIAFENAKLNELAVKNALRKNVETAYTNQLVASRNYIASKEQLVSETRAYSDMKRKYDVGQINITDFLIEENNYYKVMLANLQAKYQYVFQTKVVNFYTGVPLTQ